MTTHKFETTAWWHTPTVKIDPSSKPDFLRGVAFHDSDMKPYGWVKLGLAWFTVNIEDPNETTEEQIKLIRKQIEDVEVAAVEKVNYFNTIINNLLALPNEVPPSSSMNYGSATPDDDISF